MSQISDAIIRIDSRTAEIAADICTIKADMVNQRTDIDSLKLARARLEGQMDMLYKLVLFLGAGGIAALIRTFTSTTTP